MMDLNILFSRNTIGEWRHSQKISSWTHDQVGKGHEDTYDEVSLINQLLIKRDWLSISIDSR
jgi:hypothetical protein